VGYGASDGLTTLIPALQLGDGGRIGAFESPTLAAWPAQAEAPSPITISTTSRRIPNRPPLRKLKVITEGTVSGSGPFPRCDPLGRNLLGQSWTTHCSTPIGPQSRSVLGRPHHMCLASMTGWGAEGLRRLARRSPRCLSAGELCPNRITNGNAAGRLTSRNGFVKPTGNQWT
jgi:hypothetical protein